MRMAVQPMLLCSLIIFSAIPFSKASENETFLRTVVEDQQDSWNRPDWGYGCGSGVEQDKWGHLSSEWSLCSLGKEQSPIRILSFEAVKKPELGVLNFRYSTASASLLNDGHAITMKWNAGHLSMKERIYALEEVRFHSPSEHSIDGKIFPLEMQLFHKNMENGTVVIVSLLFKLKDKPNKFLDQLLQHIPSSGNNEAVDVEGVNPDWLEMHQKHFYEYTGSLTSPPCTEGVIWLVVKKTYKVSPAQFNKLVEGLKNENARPVQPLNDRVVYKLS